jgi:chromosome segregation ATPase
MQVEAPQHKDEVLVPSRRDTTAFPASQIRSSLSRVASLKSIPPEAKPEQQPKQPEPQSNKDKEPEILGKDPPVPIKEVDSVPEIQRAKTQIRTLLYENEHLLSSRTDLMEQIEILESYIATLQRDLKHAKQEVQYHQSASDTSQTQLESIQLKQNEMERQRVQERHVVLMKEETIQRLEQELRETKHHANVVREQDQTSRGVLQDLQERYSQVVREASFATQREKQLLQERESLQSQVEHLEQVYAESQTQVKQAKQTFEQWEQKEHVWDRQREEWKQKEIENVQKVQELTEQTQEALYERDTVAQQQKNLLVQVDQLQKEKDELVYQWRETVRLQVESVQSKAMLEKRSLCESLQQLETKYAEAMVQLDRAVREKRAAESELDKLIQHLPQETSRWEQTVEELYSKLRVVEREKHEATHQCERMHLKLQKGQAEWEQERRSLLERCEEQYRRVRGLETDQRETKEKQVSWMETMTNLEHEKKQITESMRVQQQEHQATVQQMTFRYEQRVQELQDKLEAVQQSDTQVNRDLQKLLATQQIMTSKWREEQHQQREQYEKKLAAVVAQSKEWQSRIGELECRIQTLQAQKRDYMDVATKEKERVTQYHDQLVQLQYQNEQLQRQIKKWVTKEWEWMEEKKGWMRKLDRVAVQEPKERPRRMREVMQDLDVRFPDTVTLEKEIERVKTRKPIMVRDSDEE